MLTLIEGLPLDSAFGRAQGRRDPMGLMHEWMFTLIQFQAGKKVRTPSLFNQQEKEAVRVNADELESVLGQHGLAFG